MSSLRIANRYAEALIMHATEMHVLEEVSSNLLLIQRVVKESHEFRLFLKNPVIKKEKKQQVFVATFEKSIHPLTIHFLSLLTEKNREDALLNIIAAFFQLRDELLGVINVHVKVTSELSKQHTAQLVQIFEAFSKKKVRLDIHFDKKIIGGFIARIGDTIFDGSVKRQLELLRDRLVVG